MNRRSFLSKAGLWTAGAAGCWSRDAAAALGPGSRWRYGEIGRRDDHSENGPGDQKGLEYLAGRQQDDGELGTGGYGRNVAVCRPGGHGVHRLGQHARSRPVRQASSTAASISFWPTRPKAASSTFPPPPARADVRPRLRHAVSGRMLWHDAPGRHPRQARPRRSSSSSTRRTTEGGWRYQPVRDEADISVTVCEVMALRAARNAGLLRAARNDGQEHRIRQEMPERRRRLHVHAAPAGRAPFRARRPASSHCIAPASTKGPRSTRGLSI